MRIQLAVLIFGLVTGAMANTVLFTVLGPVARDIGLTELQVGAMISAAGFVVLVFSTAVWQVVVGYAAMGLGYGLTNPAVSAAVSLAVDERVQGAAAGFVSASYAAGFIVGPLLGTALYQIDPRLTFGASALLAALALLTALRATALRTTALRTTALRTTSATAQRNQYTPDSKQP